MTPPILISVVIAIEHSEANLPEILARLSVHEYPDMEFLLCFIGDEPRIADMAGTAGNIRLVSAPLHSRIPHMWRDGIMRARGSFVAILSAHCVPDPEWIAQIRCLHLQDSEAAIGGVFTNAASASAMDWAIFILRYLHYLERGSRREVAEIAADNAVYRTDMILRYRDLLLEGFWEPGFHRRFRDSGATLGLNPELTVTHKNRYSFAQFASQRFEHGKAFGLARGRTLGTVKLAAILIVSPALPPWFFLKILLTASADGECRKHLIPALPWLTCFVACWGFGEIAGYWHALRAGRS